MPSRRAFIGGTLLGAALWPHGPLPAVLGFWFMVWLDELLAGP